MSGGGKVAPFETGDLVRSEHGATAIVQSCSMMSNGEFQTSTHDPVTLSPASISADGLVAWSKVRTGNPVTYVREFLYRIAVDEPLRYRRRKAMRNIALLVALRAAIDRELEAHVAQARHRGAAMYDTSYPSWSDIGAQLGVTKQAAQAKYGKATIAL